MKPHFASTLHVVRQMACRTTETSILSATTQPVPAPPKPLPEKTDLAARHVMVLPEGQSLTIVSADGRPLLEIASGEKGPEIRLAHDDLRIDCRGQLDFAAPD